MHMCDWLAMKAPEKPIMCTMEYIPIAYDLKITDTEGNNYKFEGIGEFQYDSLI